MCFCSPHTMLPHPLCSHKATSRPNTPQACSIALQHANKTGGCKPSRLVRIWSALQSQPVTDELTAAQPAATAVDPPQPAMPLECKPSTSQTASQESKYLSYQDYIAMQEAADQQQQQQQQQHRSSAEFGQRADETAQASSSAPTSSSSGKRVPWNKGRKHSASMIARITQATAAALARPEVKAKLDAWNQSRVGSKLPEHIKAKIADKQRASMAAKFQNMSAEELEEFHSKRSALAKRLWQDPDYVARTVTAIQAAGQRRREASAQRAAEADADSRASSSAEGSSSASSAGSSSRSGTKSRRRAARTSSSSSQAAVTEAVVEASAEAEPPAPKEPRRAHTPAKKELAATARAQLQERLDKLLHTQLVVACTEQTVQQVRSSLAAFENNPQAKEQAAATLQQAESYLGPAKRLVSKLAKDLQDHGVHWDPRTGQMTHMYDEPVEQFLRAGGGGGTKARSSSSGGSSKASRSSISRAGSRREAAGAADVGPDVVRSSRCAQQQQQGSSGAAQGMTVSSRRRGAAAEAAVGGGVRASSAGAAVMWTPVSSAAAAGPVPTNGSNCNGKNGHSAAGSGASYASVQVQRSRDSADDEDGDGDE